MTVTHASFAFLDSLGGTELLVILVVVLVFFGGEKMPEFARGLGKAIREFKKAAGDVEQEFKRAIDELPEKPPKASPAPTPPAVPPVAAADKPPFPRSSLGESRPHPEDPGTGHGIDA